MSDAVRFEGTISREIFFRAQQLHLKRRIAVARILAISAIVAGIALVQRDGSEMSAYTLAACGVTILVLFALGPVRSARQYDRSPYMHESFRGTVSPASYVVESIVGSAAIPWSKFVKAAAGDDIVLLYRGPNIFNIMAKEFFVSADDWQRARSIALEMVGHS